MGPCAPAPASFSPRSTRRSEDVTDKRPILALAPLALLAACGGEADRGAATSGEVLEGTISDSMLPVDRVRSEPPLEDPEAFAEAQSGAETAAGGDAPDDAEGEAEDEEEGAPEEAPAAEPTPEHDG